MKQTLLTLAVAGLLATSAQATPVLLDTISHEYGNGIGRIDPAGTDTLFSNYVLVSERSTSRFSDQLDFSGLSYDSIDHFVLTLTFAETKGLGGTGLLVDWRVRPGLSAYMPAMTKTGATQPVTQSFTFDSSVDTFQAMVRDSAFSLLFVDQGAALNQFRLYDAKLEVFGTRRPAASVPEPGTLALLGLSMLGGWALRRKR